MSRHVNDPLPDTLIRDEREALRLFDKETDLVLDLETSGLSPFRDKVAVVILRGENCKKTAVLHVRGVISDDLKNFLQSPERRFTGHNIGNFDLPFLYNAGVDVFRAKYWDTLVSEGVIASSGRRDVSASLKASLERRVGIRIDKNMDHSGWMNDVLTDEQLGYAGGDVEYVPDLREAHILKSTEEGSIKHLLLEQEILPVVTRMTCNGIPMDLAALDTFLQGRTEQAESLQDSIDESFGFHANLASHTQVKKGFLQAFGLTVEATNVDAMNDLKLQAIEGASQTAADLIEWRKCKQNTKMYTPQWVRNFVIDGWVHCRFWQCGAETGRFTSSSPNLQQVPRTMRAIFGNLPGYSVVSADFSQIEVRIAAALANDSAMLAALASDDIHTAVASMVFGVPIEGVTKEQRTLSKAQTFRLLFGGGATGLYQEVRLQGAPITLAEAKHHVAVFFNTFKGVSAMRDRAYYTASSRGSVVVTLPLGMRRVLSGPALSGRTLLNTAVQGSAGVGLKCAIREARRRGLDQYLGITVHDELVAVTPDSIAPEYSRELREAMITGMSEITSAPVAAEVRFGKTWAG